MNNQHLYLNTHIILSTLDIDDKRCNLLIETWDGNDPTTVDVSCPLYPWARVRTHAARCADRLRTKGEALNSYHPH